MNKYLGIVKVEDENMLGINVKLLSKTADEEKVIEQWFNLYPNAKHLLLLNNEKLDTFFSTFMDFKPVTSEEKEIAKKAEEKYKKIMNKR